MRQRKYYFAKINLFGEYVSDRIGQLWQALDSKAEVSSSEKYLWGFFDTEKATFHTGDQFYLGTLVKFRDEKQKMADRDEHLTKEVIISDLIVAESRFIVHADTGLIAYHRDGSHIKPDMFRKYFARLIVAHFQGFFLDCEVQVVGDFEAFEKRLKRFTRLDQIHLEVHRTNPGARRSYSGIEEELVRVNAHTKEVGYEAPSGQSLDIEGDEDVLDYIEMVSDGYGSAKASGEMDGRTETISSDDNQDTVFAPVDASIETLFDVIQGKFAEIRERLGH